MRLITNLKKWSPRIRNASVALLFLAAYTVSAVAPFVATPVAAAIPDVCTIDVQGANDQPGQKDLTRFCKSASDPAGTMTVSWNWDETAWSGNNSGDSCALFDTDADGFVNYAVCVTVRGNPAQQVNGSPFVYSCADDDADNCTNATPSPNTGTTCTVTQTATDPFPTGASSPTDTTATCTIALADAGGATSVLKDVCSYPSLSRPSDPSDCVITRTAHTPSATIQVVKSLSPAGSGMFTLSVNGVTATGGDGTTTGAVDVTPGTQYEVKEVGANGTVLTNFTTTVACYNGTTLLPNSGARTGAESRTISVTPADGMAVVCTFTNTRQMGTVTLVKNVVNDNGGTLGVNDFGLSVGGTAVTSGQVVSKPANVPVTINEAGAAGYRFVSITGDGCPTALGGTVTPVNGQNITCTITNDDQAATLTINKVVVNDNGGNKQPQDFQFKVDGGTATNFESDGSNTVSVNAGTHNVTEVADSGYTVTYEGCANITVPLGGSATCTVTNNDKAATLILQKTVTNNNGGKKTASDFPVYIGDTLSSWGSHTVNAGTYNVHETPDPGYTPSLWGTDCSGAGAVTLALGETKTCTITNDDKPALLSGTKYEVNAGATDGTNATGLPNWTICLDVNTNGRCDVGEPTTFTDAQGNYSFDDLSIGSYGVIELGLGGSMDGWTQIFAPQPVTLSLGDSSKGNDFGNFRNGSISGYKWNDVNGDGLEGIGENHLSGWTIQLKNQAGAVVATSVTNSNGAYSFDNVAPGNYQVCEVQQAGWIQTYPSDNNGCYAISINVSGETNQMKKFGNQGRGTVEVRKTVSPATDPGKFNLQVDDTTQATNVGNGGTTGAVSVAAGTHGVAEIAGTGTSLTNYTSSWVCVNGQTTTRGTGTAADVNVGPGQNAVCTFTNARKTGTIKVTKEVVNDDGGAAVATDFALYVNEQLVTSGVAGTFNANTSYTISEEEETGYAQTGIVCTVAGLPISMPFTLQPDQNVSCVVTNDDIAPTLLVKKVVVNTGTNRTDTPDDFSFQVNGGSTTQFEADGINSVVVRADTAYTVTEPSNPNYTTTYQNCANIRPALDTEQTCVITNTAIVRPAIHVIKTGPTQAHEGDTVTYTFTVTNPGNAPLSGLTVVDSIAGIGAVYQSGDTNDDGKLDPGETWTYKLNYTIPSPQVADVKNTVSVCGSAYGQEGRTCDEDDHVLDVLHPGIQVVKTGEAQAHEGDTVTYTFTVTNTGDTPLANVAVSDSIVPLVVYQSGDENENDLLDLDETWVFTATYQIPLAQTADVKNTATATGEDNLGEEVESSDDHTLDVLHPALTVVKSGPTNAVVGSTATYTFTITNTGDTPLAVQSVIDDLAGEAEYVSGDTDDDGLLDVGEVWVATASYKLPTTPGNVKNTVTVCAVDELEEETCEEASHTTIVYQPQVLSEVTPPKPTLMDTGTSLLWQTATSLGILGFALWIVRSRGDKQKSSARAVMFSRLTL